MSAIDFIDIGSGDRRVVAASVQGRLTADDMVRFNARITELHEAGQKALVYLDLTGHDGQDFAGVAREKMSHIGELWSGIERTAYVVDREWIMKLAGVIDMITPMHFRAFPAEDADEAKRWVIDG